MCMLSIACLWRNTSMYQPKSQRKGTIKNNIPFLLIETMCFPHTDSGVRCKYFSTYNRCWIKHKISQSSFNYQSIYYSWPSSNAVPLWFPKKRLTSFLWAVVSFCVRVVMVLWSCRTLVSLWASEFLKPWNSLDRLRSSPSVCSSLV